MLADLSVSLELHAKRRKNEKIQARLKDRSEGIGCRLLGLGKINP